MPRGGARKGSGRKPLPERARLDVRVSAEVRAQVEADAARTGEGVSEWIRQAVLERLERRRGMARLKGHEAIEAAEEQGRTLSKYADPTEGAREGLTPAEAREIAREDPGLIYLDSD